MFQLGIVKSYPCQRNRLDFARRHADLPTQGFEPLRDRLLPAARPRRHIL